MRSCLTIVIFYADFERALQLEPRNEAAQHELKKVSQRIAERDLKLQKVANVMLVSVWHRLMQWLTLAETCGRELVLRRRPKAETSAHYDRRH